MPNKTKIIDLAHNGSGFAKSESGKAIFIPFTIVDEEVLYDIEKENKKYILGEVKTIVKKSNSRVEPKCKYFKKCGGCNLQHIEIKKQRELKLNILKQTLDKQFKIIPENGYQLIGSELPDYSYRNRIKLSVSKNGKIGFLKHSSRSIIEINECPIAEKDLNETVRELSEYTFPKEAREVFIEKTENGITVLVKNLSNNNFKKIKTSFAHLNITQETLISSFSQVNNFANEILKNKVLELIDESEITELFAGSGNFSIELAKRGAQVKAVEIDKNLVALGKEKAKKFSLANLNFVYSKAEEYVNSNSISKTLLLDPPRNGAFDIVKKLNPKQINKVVYVSCKPATLGRDLQALKENGFKIRKIFALDMFPQTPHLECIAVIEA